jgi:hypothetical protein
MVINIGVAAHWKVVTFKGTHLIERMSLLTLYIRKSSNCAILLFFDFINTFYSWRGSNRYPQECC